MNRKGSLEDIGALVIVIFAAAIMFIAATVGYTSFVDKAVNITAINSSQSAVDAFNTTKDLQSRYDYVVFGLLIGFTLAIMIGSWFVPGHPIFGFIYFIGLIIFIVLGLILSYAWNNISTRITFADAIEYFPITDFILNNFGIYITIVGFLAMIIMFGKPYISGEA